MEGRHDLLRFRNRYVVGQPDMTDAFYTRIPPPISCMPLRFRYTQGYPSLLVDLSLFCVYFSLSVETTRSRTIPALYILTNGRAILVLSHVKSIENFHTRRQVSLWLEMVPFVAPASVCR